MMRVSPCHETLGRHRNKQKQAPKNSLSTVLDSQKGWIVLPSLALRMPHSFIRPSFHHPSQSRFFEPGGGALAFARRGAQENSEIHAGAICHRDNQPNYGRTAWRGVTSSLSIDCTRSRHAYLLACVVFLQFELTILLIAEIGILNF